MQLDPYILGGLVGLTLVVSSSGVLDDLRDYLLGYEFWANPLHVMGRIMASTLAVGFIAGSIDGGNPLFGGIVALAAHMADELLALMAALVRKIMPMSMPMPGMMPRAPGYAGEPDDDEEPVIGPRPLTEDQAHSMADTIDREETGT
jgi:hypothetical protein